MHSHTRDMYYYWPRDFVATPRYGHSHGVLSQQPKMSEAQEVSSAVERRESNATEITRQKSEINEEREEDEQRDESETQKSESAATTPRCDEPTEKKLFGGGGAVPDVHQRPAGQQQQQQQQKPVAAAPATRQQVGECNLLPVLVERLRSALELSCSSSSCDDQLPLEDSGVDSEEDFRLWNTAGLVAATGAAATTGKPKLDLKFLEDILLADIHTALARLQDTLKRVDIGTLTRYNASLDPSNKLYLLRLISNLLAKLKVPEEAIVQGDEPEHGAAHQGRFHNRRRKNERHTIGVSAEEIARAKRWFDEKSVSSNDSSSPSRVEGIADKDLVVGSSSIERIVEGAPSATAVETPAIEDKLVVLQETAPTPMKPGTFSDKCMKDAINQQQCKSNREQENSARYDPLERVLTAPRRFDGLCKDDSSIADGFQERSAASFYQQQQPHHSGPRHNKFTAKKSKIKRANTIDIPNYLKLKSDSPDQVQNGCFALRRPIDVGDRLTNGHHQRVVPSFEPKTENDRKFLALINKNNSNAETATSQTANGSPFKSFNYRQAATVADKNWSNRFWNIKTNFDKPTRSEGEEELPRKPGKLDVRKKFENRDDSLEREAMLVGSLRVMPQKQVNGFTHAPTSPFQKIEKPVAKQPETGPPFLKAAGYMPKNNNMLQAKLKMFDQEPAKSNAETRAKSKFGKPPENKKPSAPSQPLENGQLNYYSFCKQFAPFASGRSNANEGKSNVNSTKSKLLENIQKETDKPEPAKRDRPKVPTTQSSSQQHDFSKQYSYHKPYEGYAYQDYRQLEKKPQFNSPRGSFQAQEADFVKPEKPPRRFAEASTQNVAVQTTLESCTDRRPSAPELLVSSSVEHPVPQPRKRNSVSVQTTSPSLLSPVNYNAQTSTSPSITSPIPHAHQAFKPANYSGYHAPMPADQVPRNYYSNGSSYDYNAYPCKSNQHEVLSPKPTPAVPETPQLQGISQKLYNEFSKLPDSNPAPRGPSFDYGKIDAPACDEAKILAFKPTVYPYEDPVGKPLPDVVEENIENQDISSDGIVTRYTCAIATISPDSPEPASDKAPRSYEPVVPRIKEPQPQPHFAETTNVGCNLDEIQRHNMLQQQLIRRMQTEPATERIVAPSNRRFSQEIGRKENRSPAVSPSSTPFSSANFPGRVCALKALNESHKAQEKIHMFEEKRNSGSQQLFRPLNVPPKVSVVNPSSVLRQERSPIRNASPIDSSDEYLMSCASKPSRNLVLSKSESWHQLALARGAGGLAPVSQLKPPKPKSPSSLRLSKQFEASSASDNMRKMEEKIQRYFQGSGGAATAAAAASASAAPVNYSHHEETTTKSKAKSKRNLQNKKSMNSLMRSHTMPHLFDDSVDVDQAFDSIFKEATRADNRH
ncbi:uncharacterized protein LOC100123846 isoform X2 [Nasonia vitripennis]|uniref:Uncharacterized protein n=1 Tax=Nasonia vitripennis TaxID=7425 RepID=A0A7M7QPG0_NASVI|nr:uncharacterized protein LOC100123846 isoform X2 [Nasonia vitripennis]XP_032452783.1 uncharacterized protein LOC100123846 isoform X2 [Nasonia vitripennis]